MDKPRSLAVILKVMFILVLLASMVGHWWSIWTVAFWGMGAGLLFAVLDRYNWYITRAGCDLWGSGVLLLTLGCIVKFSPFVLLEKIASQAILLFSVYFVVINVYHLICLARRWGYRFPIVVILSEPLFRKLYFGVETVTGN